MKVNPKVSYYSRTFILYAVATAPLYTSVILILCAVLLFGPDRVGSEYRGILSTLMVLAALVFITGLFVARYGDRWDRKLRAEAEVLFPRRK